MLFTSMTFLWIFLPVVFVLYRLVKDLNLRNVILFAAGLVFYVWGSAPRDIPVFVLLIIFNYAAGLMIGKERFDPKMLLIISVAVNVAALCIFKYSGFLADLSLHGFENLSMPIGISFFTFQNISYLVDVYRKEISAENNLFYYTMHISFFAKLISGPIVENGTFLRQLRERETSAARTAYGIKRFIYGFGKKAIIADQLAVAADGLFDIDVNVIPTGYAWAAALLYSFQLYYDSSGYVDMAIGISQMFGFDLPENFNYPYTALSVTDFWRRWHISLTSWFRKYVYFPLGGSRKGKYRTLLNIGIIFALTGIWHGSGLCFLAWGLWHGFFMILERAFKPRFEKIKIPSVVKYLYTFVVVLLGWVFFRAGSLSRALQMIKAMIVFRNGNVLPIRMFAGPGTLAVLIVAIILSGPVQTLFPKLKDALFDREYTGPLQICVLILIFVLGIIFTVSGTYNAFIYFRF